MMRRNVISGAIPLVFSILIMGSIPIITADPDVLDSTISTGPVGGRDNDIYAEICTWHGNRNGALSFTFDDGLASQADIASPALNDFGLNGTFFVTVGNVGIPFGAEWFEWQEASDYGHEIGAHSINHPDLTTLSPDDLWDEVVFAKQMIESNLSGVEVETMSYPMGMYNSTVTSLVSQHYIGARGDRHNISAQPAPNPSTPENIYGVVPVNFGYSESLQDMDDLVDDTINSKGWMVEMIHAVHDSGYDPVSYDTFTDHLDYVTSREDRLWVGTYVDVTKYIRVRDSAVLNIVENRTDRYEITLDSPLDPDVFDQEITVKIISPIDWIDISITKGDDTTVITPEILGGAGTIFMDMKIGEIILVERVNAHPMISLPTDPEFQGRPFTPGIGSSETVFKFGLEYSSSRNRAPLHDPIMSIDVNGDGDLTDTIGDFTEGDHSLIKTDGSDMDFTDGCGYHLFLSLPPGSDPKITFEARDSERLDATGEIASLMPGPHMNDPPTPPVLFDIGSLHDVTPDIRWESSEDPDGDDIFYIVELMGGNLQWERNTTWNRIDVDVPLEFSIPYVISIRAVDDDGAESIGASMSFMLGNSCPGYISNLSVEYDDDLILSVRFSPAVDPEGDDVHHHVTLIQDPEGENIDLVKGNMTGMAFFTLNKPLLDHTDYEIGIGGIDNFGLSGPVTIHRFRVNIPPAPVANLTTADTVGMENSLDISWDPSPEKDLSEYVIYREGGVSGGINVGNSTFFRDTDVIDGNSYRYEVVAVDMDGSVDLVNISSAIGFPLDDVAPDRVTNLMAADLVNATSSISLKWDTSIDGRFHRYRIYRRNDSSINPVIVHMTDPRDRYDSSWIDLDVIDNSTYHYGVTAVDIYGNEDMESVVWIQGASVDDRPDPPQEDEIQDVPDCGNNEWIPILAVVLFILSLVLIGIALVIYNRGRTEPEDDSEFD